MLSWIYGFLIGNFCRHTWEIIRQSPVVSNSNIVRGYYYDLRCSKCGNIKETRTIS